MPTYTSTTPNSSRSTRSASRGRGFRRGSSSSSPYAQQSPGRPGFFSPPPPGKLPAGRGKGEQQQQHSPFSDVDPDPVSNDSKALGLPNINEQRVTLDDKGEHEEVIEEWNTKMDNSTLAATLRVSDNEGSDSRTPSPVQANTTKSAPGGATDPPSQEISEYWHRAFDELKGIATQTCQELKTINGRLDKLDKVDLATEKLSEQVSGVLQRTTALEDLTSQNSNLIKELQAEVRGLKSTVASQEEIISELKDLKSTVASHQKIIAECKGLKATIVAQEEVISELQALKNEVPIIKADFTQKSQEQVQEFSRLIGVQQKQVDGFHETNNKIQEVIQDNITQYFQEQMDTWTKESDYKSLKDQANRNKNNLIIIGLPEEDRSPLASASEFVSSTLGIKSVHIDVAYRLGPPPPEGSSYARPILMRFTHMADRNKVWRRKTPITTEDGTAVIRIQQDLPKKLREDAHTLHRVLRAASAFPKYKAAKIIDYKIVLHGKTYDTTKLEQLPKPIRPSSLASKTSESVHIFFTRHSILSNHHPARFTIKGIHYANMEHYLAHQRATFSGDKDIIQRALEASDPLVAKAILNQLKKDRTQEWQERLDKILLVGLRGKFGQNPNLLKFLLDTQNLKLGEASQDPRWGIGFSLDDPTALDPDKWLPTGNLLGRTLSRVREEFAKQAQTQASTSDQPRDPQQAAVQSSTKSQETTQGRATPSRSAPDKASKDNRSTPSGSAPDKASKNNNSDKTTPTASTDKGAKKNNQDKTNPMAPTEKVTKNTSKPQSKPQDPAEDTTTEATPSNKEPDHPPRKKPLEEPKPAKIDKKSKGKKNTGEVREEIIPPTHKDSKNSKNTSKAPK